MATAKPLLETAQLSLNTGGTVQYFIDGVDASDPWAHGSQVLTAGGLPQKGDPYGAFGNVLDVRTDKLFPQGGLVTIQVGFESGGNSGSGNEIDDVSIEFDSYVAQITTQVDYGGEPIVVIYNPDDRGDKNVPSASTGDDSQLAEVSGYESIITLRVQRNETDAQKAIEKQRTLVNRVGVDEFAGFGGGTWMCMRVNVPLRVVRGDLQTPFPVTYEFHARRDGWLKSARYILPETGQAPTKNVPELNVFEHPPRVEMSPNFGDHQQRRNGYTLVNVTGFEFFADLGFPLL